MPTVHRLTALLTERGWLDRDPGTRRLRLGLEMARLVPAAARRPAVARARPPPPARADRRPAGDGQRRDPPGRGGGLSAQRVRRPPAHLPGVGRDAAARALHGARQVPARPAARGGRRATSSAPSPTSRRTDRTADEVETEARTAWRRSAAAGVSHLRRGIRGRTGLDRRARALDRAARAPARSMSRCPPGGRRPRSVSSSTRGLLEAARAIDREMSMARAHPPVTVRRHARRAGACRRGRRVCANRSRRSSPPIRPLRYQGMPSDGDSRRRLPCAWRAGWIGLHWPQALGGRGLSPLHTVGLRRALRLPLAAPVGIPAVGQDDRQRAAALRLPGAAGAAPPRGRGRTDALLPGLLRARRRLRSRLAAHAGSPDDGPLHRQRAQDLDLERRLRRLGLPRRAHRLRARAPPRHLGARRRHQHPRDHRARPIARSAAGRSASSS